MPFWPKKNYTMGVINFTPDSFSDGGFHLDRRALISTFEKFQSFDPDVIFDLGMESTAPMNAPISEEEERDRFHDALAVLNEENLLARINILSIDTYKIENFAYYYRILKKKFPHLKLIWNDVSGVFDQSVQNFLRQHPEVVYVYNSTRISSRDILHRHPELAHFNPKIVEEIGDSFKRVHQWFKENHVIENLILDPGLGFSKTSQENWLILNSLNFLKLFLEKEGIYVPLLFGLSKKSFMRAPFKELSLIDSHLDLKIESEALHFHCLLLILKTGLKNPLFFRVHDEKILFKAKLFIEFSPHGA